MTRSIRLTGSGSIGIALLMALGALFVAPSTGYAVPSLELDILGGHYDSQKHTIVASGDQFTLFAILTPDPHTSVASQLSETYYISSAVVPKTGPLGSQLGTFTFGGTPVRVTADMVYGTPPIELSGATTPDQFDLNEPAIFQTFFSQYGFHFSPDQRANQYDTLLNPGVGPTPNPTGPSYYMAFQIDTGGLSGGLALHFDLYNEILRSPCRDPFAPTVPGNFPCDVDVKKFAPLDHGAESPPRRVPEARTLLLLGSGMVIAGLSFSKRQRRG